MGIAEAIMQMISARNDWELQQPLVQAQAAKLRQDAEASKADVKFKQDLAKIFDGFNKANPNFLKDVQAAEQEATQPQQQPQGLTDMMTPQFALSFGDRATGQNESQGIMPQGDISQMPGMQPAQAAPQQQPQGQSGGDDVLSLLSNPIVLAMAKMAGIDLTSIGSLIQRQKDSQRLGRQGDERIAETIRGTNLSNEDRDAAREQAERHFRKTFSQKERGYKTEPVKLPDGSEGIVVLPQFQGQGLGDVGKVIKTSPSLKSMPIAEQNIPLWRHPKTLDSPPIGMTPKQAEAEGYKRLSTAQVDTVQNFGQVENILGAIEKLMEKVFPKEESALGRMIGAPMRQLSAMAQTNQDAAMLMRLINGTLAPIVRSMGEKGNLSDTDIKRAGKLFPNLMDRGPVAWGILKQLEEIITRNKKTKFGEMGLEVSKKPESGSSRFKIIKVE